MNRLRAFLCLAVFLTSLPGIAIDTPSFWYTVVQGDRISTLLSTLQQCPLYGKGRAVDRLTFQNPGKINKAGNFVWAGARIELGVRDLPPSADYEVRPGGEVIIKTYNTLNCSPTVAKKETNRKVAELKLDTPEIKSEPKLEVKEAVKEEIKEEIIVKQEIKEQKVEAEEDSVKSIVELVPMFTYISLVGRDNATRATATILSDQNYGARLTWRQDWGGGDQTYISFSNLRVNLQAPTNRVLDTDRTSLSSFYLGFSKQLSSRLSFGLFAGLEQELTLLAVSATTLSFPRMSVPRGGATVGLDLLKKGKMSFGVEASGSYHLPARNTSTSYKGGLNDYQGRLKLRHDAKACSLLGGVFYRREKMISAPVNTTRTDLGVELGIGFVFGE